MNYLPHNFWEFMGLAMILIFQYRQWRMLHRIEVSQHVMQNEVATISNMRPVRPEDLRKT